MLELDISANPVLVADAADEVLDATLDRVVVDNKLSGLSVAEAETLAGPRYVEDEVLIDSSFASTLWKLALLDSLDMLEYARVLEAHSELEVVIGEADSDSRVSLSVTVEPSEEMAVVSTEKDSVELLDPSHSESVAVIEYELSKELLGVDVLTDDALGDPVSDTDVGN